MTLDEVAQDYSLEGGVTRDGDQVNIRHRQLVYREAVRKFYEMTSEVNLRVANDFLFGPTKNIRFDDLLELVLSLLTTSSFSVGRLSFSSLVKFVLILFNYVFIYRELAFTIGSSNFTFKFATVPSRSS